MMVVAVANGRASEWSPMGTRPSKQRRPLVESAYSLCSDGCTVYYYTLGEYRCFTVVCL